ncbi:MAG: Veg family protein [bacterium]|nr:Veg family protein [Mycoplasmatota bacterium]MDD6757472.1 Veg family protein [bacterium]MDY2908848.1 Veg family protein [Candidatus Faecimonas sp.]
MMIDNIKKVVEQNQGIKCSFRFHGSRNQVDEFHGVIVDLYPAIFTIETENNKIKTFSYSDILTQSLEILP